MAVTLPGHAPARAQETPPDTWSLDECLEAALRNAPQVVQARLDAAIAEARVSEARAARLPHFTWQTQVLGMTPFVDAIVLRAGTYGELSIPTVPNFGSTTYVPPPNITVFDGMPGKYLTTSVQVVQPLFTSGKINAAIRLARLNRRLSEQQLEETGYQAAYYVRQVYLGILVARASLDLLQTMEAEMTRILEDTRALLEQGLVAEADVLEAEAGLKQIEEQISSTNARLVEARESLRLLTGASPTDPMVVEGTLAPPDSEVEVPSEDELLEVAFRRRPEMATREAQHALAQANVRYRRTDRPFRPTLGLSVEYGARGDRWPGLQTNWTMSWDDYYTAVAQLQLNLYDGGESSARERQARLQQEKAAAGLDQTRNLIIQQVRQAVAGLESARAGLVRARARLAEHEEKHRTARLGFDTGAVGRSEYLAEYLEWCKARSEHLLALFNLAQARLELDLATGALPRTPEEVRHPGVKPASAPTNPEPDGARAASPVPGEPEGDENEGGKE